MTKEQLLNMPIGETVVDGNWDILRVLGGWIYCKLFFEDNGRYGAELVTTSAMTSVFVSEPKTGVPKFIQLTNDDSRNVFINTDAIASVIQRIHGWSLIYYIGDNDYCEPVKENYDDIVAMIAKTYL